MSTDELATLDSGIPANGMLFGIDFGTKRVGIAVSDREQRLASPLHIHQRQGIPGDTRLFRKLADEYRPAGLIVGLPLHMNGDESQKSAEARQFADWLGEILQLPHTFQDERLTSWQAEKLLLTAEFSSRQRKQKIDKLAAQILLQTWLDKRRNTRGGNTDQAASNPSTP